MSSRIRGLARASRSFPRAAPLPPPPALVGAMFVPRVLVCMIFVGSAFDVLANFGADGGPALPALEAKLDAAHKALRSVDATRAAVDAGGALLASAVPRVAYAPKTLLMAAAIVQLVGAALLLADFAVGARILALFLVVVTPIMHSFWSEPPNSYAQSLEYITFLKNLAILGGLLLYVGHKNEAHRLRRSLGVAKAKAA